MSKKKRNGATAFTIPTEEINRRIVEAGSVSEEAALQAVAAMFAEKQAELGEDDERAQKIESSMFKDMPVVQRQTSVDEYRPIALLIEAA